MLLKLLWKYNGWGRARRIYLWIPWASTELSKTTEKAVNPIIIAAIVAKSIVFVIKV